MRTFRLFLVLELLFGSSSFLIDDAVPDGGTNERITCSLPTSLAELRYCRFQKIAPRVRKLFLNMSFTVGEEPPRTLGEELQTARYYR